ncbi:MAG: acyl-CoA/acyl-ACP dehydrogenase [Caldilineales bacterium]|nr:acyl-CoA/acyl-ACP dehydrogenase [Caldilineales bacterium]
MTPSNTDPAHLAQTLAAAIRPRAAAADRLGRLPAQDIEALRQSGYLGLSVPAEFGGFGVSLRQAVAAQMELAQGSTSTALVAAMQLHLFGHASEVRAWSPARIAWMCEQAVQGKLFNFVASEPVLGSPSRGGVFQTTAEEHPEGWVVNGHKTWSTGGRHLDYLLVRVSVGDTTGVVMVENNRPGVEWRETWCDALALRASDSHDVYFRSVVVPPDHLLEQGPTAVDHPSAWFPMMMAATYLGTAIAARDDVIRYALERTPTALGKPIATLPGIQRQVGEMDVALQAAQAFLLAATGEWTGRTEDAVAQYPRIIAAKQFAVETALTVTEQALRIAGGASLSPDLPLERYFRDVRAGLMQPPSGDQAYEQVGRAAIARIDPEF